jgi:peptidylprolyl isomerase
MNRSIIASLAALSLMFSACGTSAADAPKPETKEDAAKAAAGGQPTQPAPSDVAAPPADAQKTPSGLAWKVLTSGPGGEKPVAASTVTVHYTGWTTDGKMFDSSLNRGQPAKFPLDRVIKGWTEGLQLMSKGDKVRFWIPTELAYNNAPGKPAGMLVFDVELLDFKSPIPAPADVAAVPPEAKKTASGLAYKSLQPGTGADHPKASSRVTVHYTGWTTDGKMFDSSVLRDKPTTFPLTGVIKGWTEGLQLMVPGEKMRFWIPKELAYNDAPGKPAGMLVFDVELISYTDAAPGANGKPTAHPTPAN